MSRKPSISLNNGNGASNHQANVKFSSANQVQAPVPPLIEGPTKRQRTGTNGHSSRNQEEEEPLQRESRMSEGGASSKASAKTLTKKKLEEFNRANQRGAGTD